MARPWSLGGAAVCIGALNSAGLTPVASAIGTVSGWITGVADAQAEALLVSAEAGGPEFGTSIDLADPGMSVNELGVDLSESPSGNYNEQFSSGTMYHGKGGPERAEASALRLAAKHGDTIVSVEYNPQPTETAAFEQEAREIRASGGLEEPNPDLYNKINSPGERMLKEDGE